MKENPLVSIIIPTLNSERTLERCLNSIKFQSYKNIEIIVVDEGSRDNTVEIAKRYNCKIFILEVKERSPSINYGVKVSNGKYIYRADSDVVLDGTLVEEAVEKCEIEGYDAVSIFCSPDPTISFWAKVRKLEKDCYKDDLLYSGARFLRKDVFEAIGGFDENLVAGEDYDLYNRLARTTYKIAIIKAQELHIGEPRSIEDIIKKQYYYGRTIKAFLKANKAKGLVQMSPIRIPLIKNWKKFITHPILTVGFIFYEFIVYTSAIIGFIASFLHKDVFVNREFGDNQ